MRKIFVISAYILTFGAAVVVGAIFAQISVPSGAVISAQTPVPSTVNTYAIADNPQARQSPSSTQDQNANQQGPSLWAAPAQPQFAQAYPPISSPTPPNGYIQVNGGQVAGTDWQAPTGSPQYMVPLAAPTRSALVRDPDNPGQFKPVDESTQKIAILLHELREAQESSPNPEKLQTLRRLVAEQFDKRHKSQVARLETIQAELQRTQEILDRRNGQRDEIIERRLAQLLGEQDPLQWDYQPAVPQLSSPYQGYPTPRSATPTTSPGVPQFPIAPGQYPYPNITGPNNAYGAGEVYPSGPYPPQLPRNSSEDEAAQAAENDARRARVAADELQRRANSLRNSAPGSTAPAQSPATIPTVEPEATQDTPPAVELPPSPEV